MDDLRVFEQHRGTGCHRPVQADRAQRPSGDQHHGTRWVDAHRLGPRLAHGRAIGRELRRERADRRPQRQPDALHTAPGSRLEAGVLIRRTDERSVTRAELVGHAGSGVLLMDDDGYAHPVRRGIHRSRGIAAESDHDVRVTRTQDIADLAGLAHPLGRKLERGLVGAPRERDLFDGVQLIAGAGNKVVLQSYGRADDADGSLGPDTANRIRHGQQRVDMTGGAAACQNDMHR